MPDITLTPTVEAEVQYDAAMRPRSFDEYVGQPHVKDALKIALDAASFRKEPIEHVLIYGGFGQNDVGPYHRQPHERTLAGNIGPRD